MEMSLKLLVVGLNEINEVSEDRRRKAKQGLAPKIL